jgi:hypothetical protein
MPEGNFLTVAAGTGTDAVDRRGGVWLIALVALAVELWAIRAYGWFRDELYYVACSRHLAFGYVDHPPVVALIAWAARHLPVDPLIALRLVSAVTGIAVIFLCARLAHELGGGRFAQLLTAVCILVAPRYLSAFHYFAISVFELLLWTLATLVVARLLRGGDPRGWLLFGGVAGIGLETKHSMLFFGLGIFAGFVMTPARRAFRSPWIWLGGGLAALLFLPNILWQVFHGWPTLEFLQNAQTQKNLPLGALEFFRQQIIPMQPLSLPIWLTGLGWYFFARRGRQFRPLGWAFLVIVAVLLLNHAKGYYLGPAFPMLFAAGAVAVEAATSSTQWLRPVVVALLLVAGAVTAPLTLPLLPVEDFIRYQAWLGMHPNSPERKAVSDLPQQYADMFGWPEMAAEVARVYRTLPLERRARACVYGQNYGEAAAVEQLGSSCGLPADLPVLSSHNSYYLWGPGRCDGTTLIVIGGSEDEGRRFCSELTRAGTILSHHAMPYENNLPVWICRLGLSMTSFWQSAKSYD